MSNEDFLKEIGVYPVSNGITKDDVFIILTTVSLGVMWVTSVYYFSKGLIGIIGCQDQGDIMTKKQHDEIKRYLRAVNNNLFLIGLELACIAGILFAS